MSFAQHEAVRIGVPYGGARPNRCHSERAISLWGAVNSPAHIAVLDNLLQPSEREQRGRQKGQNMDGEL